MDDSAGRKQEEESGGGDAPWMATYADMMTLLFCFFVLMFAISSVDAQKFALFAAAVSNKGLTPEIYAEIMETHKVEPTDDPDISDPRVPVETAPPDGGEDTAPPTDDGEGDGGGPDIIGGGGDNDYLGNLYFSIKDYILANDMGDSVMVELAGEEVMITLKNDIWFQSGSAAVTSEMEESGMILAQLLRDSQNEDFPFNIIVVGHTDNRPISTAQFPSNWHLSVYRAVEFMDILVRESGLDPYYFSARGCGETKPIGNNNTVEGQQQNRRVELFVSYFTQAKDFF